MGGDFSGFRQGFQKGQKQKTSLKGLKSKSSLFNFKLYDYSLLAYQISIMNRKITYKIVESKDPLIQDAFDPLGAIGFELITVVHDLKLDRYIYYFKLAEAHQLS